MVRAINVQPLLPVRPSMVDWESRWGKCHVVKLWWIVGGMCNFRAGNWYVWMVGLLTLYGAGGAGLVWVLWGGLWAGWRRRWILLGCSGCLTGWYALVMSLSLVCHSWEVKYVPESGSEALENWLSTSVVSSSSSELSSEVSVWFSNNPLLNVWLSSSTLFSKGSWQIGHVPVGEMQSWWRVWKHASLLMSVLDGERQVGKSHRVSLSGWIWPRLTFW